MRSDHTRLLKVNKMLCVFVRFHKFSNSNRYLGERRTLLETGLYLRLPFIPNIY